MGANGGITLNGIGLRILEVSNVIVRYGTSISVHLLASDLSNFQEPQNI